MGLQTDQFSVLSPILTVYVSCVETMGLCLGMNLFTCGMNQLSLKVILCHHSLLLLPKVKIFPCNQIQMIYRVVLWGGSSTLG